MELNNLVKITKTRLELAEVLDQVEQNFIEGSQRSKIKIWRSNKKF